MEHGACPLEQAIAAVVAQGRCHVPDVRLLLRQRGHVVPRLSAALPDDPRLRSVTVRPHALADYDHLTRKTEETDEDPA